MKRALTILLVLLLRIQTDAFSFRGGIRKHGITAAHVPLSSSHHSSVNGDSLSEQSTRDNEALLAFEEDVTKVIRELRSSVNDPTVPTYFSSKRLSFTNYWNLDDWERHNSRWRFTRYIRGIPTSRLTRRILPQMSVLVVWSLLSLTLHSKSVFFGRVNVPIEALSLISTFVAALLTLRTNQALNRLMLGRNAMGKMVLLTRDAAMLFATYIYPKNPVLGLKAGISISKVL